MCNNSFILFFFMHYNNNKNIVVRVIRREQLKFYAFNFRTNTAYLVVYLFTFYFISIYRFNSGWTRESNSANLKMIINLFSSLDKFFLYKYKYNKHISDKILITQKYESESFSAWFFLFSSILKSNYKITQRARSQLIGERLDGRRLDSEFCVCVHLIRIDPVIRSVFFFCSNI